jgi:hypothetical protein
MHNPMESAGRLSQTFVLRRPTGIASAIPQFRRSRDGIKEYRFAGAGEEGGVHVGMADTSGGQR